MDSSIKSTQRPQTGSHKKRSTMIKSMAHMSDNAGVDGVQRPKSAPKPVTPSSKHRDGNKNRGGIYGVKNDGNRSNNGSKRHKKKRPSGPPIRGSKNDLLAKKLGLRSFKNTTPQDLEMLMTMAVSIKEAKQLGKIAVSEKNWELAEVAYNLCVEKPAYGTEGNYREKKLFENRRVGSSRAKQAPRLSPIKIRGNYRPHTQQSSRSRRRMKKSPTKEMLDYEQNWRNGTPGKSWNRNSSRSRSNSSSKSVASRKSPKLFNFLDNEHPPPFMSHETLLRLSAPRVSRSPPKLNNIPCEASGRWKGNQGGKFSTAKPKSDVEWIIYRSKQVPGPSHYRPKLVEPKKGIKFSDANPKGDVDWIIYRSKQTPGPGQYRLKSTLAGGGVKFSDANPKSDLEWTIYNASQIPGPARYNIELCP